MMNPRKFLGLLIILAGLQACTSLQWQQGGGNHREEGRRRFAEVSDILAYRQERCALPEQHREQLIQQYRDYSNSEELLSLLVLASCAPEKTPGLLGTSIIQARAQLDEPQGVDQLLDLMEAHWRAYSKVEEKLRNTEARLETTINGIREIETQMNLEVTGENDNHHD